MSFDCSRFSFHPWKDFFGVVMQQGRVQLDADWNEWVAELARRLQAGTMDTVGRAVVPRITPDGFRILATGGVLTIGPGRMYVDGLLAENHGAAPLAWDPSLAETTGTGAVPFFEQPYLPFNPTNQPAPADMFNRPALTGGPHLVYLDVWQRELTHLQEPGLVEKAVGVDTTGRAADGVAGEGAAERREQHHVRDTRREHSGLARGDSRRPARSSPRTPATFRAIPTPASCRRRSVTRGWRTSSTGWRSIAAGRRPRPPSSGRATTRPWPRA